MQETPEQLHARLMGLPPPEDAPKDVGATENAPAEQKNEEDPAMAEAREKVNTYRNLYQLSQQDTSKHGAHVGESIADNALGIGTGLLGGAGVRKGLGMVAPEGFLYNPELPKIQNVDLPEAEQKLGKFHGDVVSDLERRNQLRNEHVQQGHELKTEASIKQRELMNTERELAEARKHHLNAQSLEPEHFLPPEQVETRVSEPERAELTKKPLGGTATEKYALSYGATPEEAKLVASPSVMQQQNIPSQASALERIKGISPNAVMTEESPLLLPPDAQKAVEERKAQQMEQEAKAKRDADFKQAQRQAAAKQVAMARLEAEQRVKDLEAQRKEQLKAAQDAEKEHREHMKKLPPVATPTAPEKSAYDTMTEEVDKLRNKINEQIGRYGKYGNMVAKIGTKIAPRFVPIYGSAMALPQAHAAAEEFHRGNPIKGGLYTLGSTGAAMQGTGNPFLMGAGDILQAPAAALGIYDILNEKPRD